MALRKLLVLRPKAWFFLSGRCRRVSEHARVRMRAPWRYRAGRRCRTLGGFGDATFPRLIDSSSCSIDQDRQRTRVQPPRQHRTASATTGDQGHKARHFFTRAAKTAAKHYPPPWELKGTPKETERTMASGTSFSLTQSASPGSMFEWLWRL